MSAGKRTPEMAARLVETGLNRLIRATIKILPFKEAQKTQSGGAGICRAGEVEELNGRFPFGRSEPF